MRARLVRPEFWSDALMAELSVGTRLTYIGLWGEADDDGYLVLRSAKDQESGEVSVDVQEIAGDLYRHEGKKVREHRVREAILSLVRQHRVVLLSCGKHAVIPTIPAYRVKSGVLLFTVRKKHESDCTSLALSSPKEGSDSDSGSDRDSDSDWIGNQGRKTATKRSRDRSSPGVRPLSEIVPEMAARFGRKDG